MQGPKMCALLAVALAVSSCDSGSSDPSADGAAAQPASEETAAVSASEPAVGATGVPIDPAAKTVLIVNAPAVVSLSAQNRVAGLGAQQAETQRKIGRFMEGYARSLDDPAAKDRLVEQNAADLEVYKRQSLELYNAQRALEGK